MEDTTQPGSGFNNVGLVPEIVAVLNKLQFKNPTPIQKEAIPVAITGKDVIGIAQTGTGKTLAFSLPIIQTLLATNGKALVLVPTRELAIQVEENVRKITRSLPRGVRTICLIGGVPIYRQIKDMQHKPRIIIATPGRLNDHLAQKTLSLSDTKIVVLDEADRMLDMGFAPQINRALDMVPKERQTLLFSATMAPEVATIAKSYMNDPVRIEVENTQNMNGANIKQELCYVHQNNKIDVLKNLLNLHEGTILVFTRTKYGASKLSKTVHGLGHPSAEIHSNRSLNQRKKALDGFKSGQYRVLVATDVAARGIDVHNIELVINYDLPDAAEDYVHRIGRTGRAGLSGHAISFAGHDQYRDVKNIERIIKKTIPLSEHSEQPKEFAQPNRERRYDNGNYSRQQSRPQFGGQRSSGRPTQRNTGESSGSGVSSPAHFVARRPGNRPFRKAGVPARRSYR